MESCAPVSDLITGTVLFNRLVESVIVRATPYTLTQYRILVHLSVCGKVHVRVSDLARALVLKASTISDSVTQLERGDLIKRGEIPGNLKAVCVELTERGESELASCNDALLRDIDFYWKLFDKETVEGFFSYVKMYLRDSDVDMDLLEKTEKPVYYAYGSRRFLQSNVSWFKSTYNLGLGDFRIMLLLLEWDKALRCSDIAQLLQLSPSSITSSVKYLSTVKGFIERHKDDANKREVEVCLTALGVDTASEIKDRFIRCNATAFGLSLDDFHKMLDKAQVRHMLNTTEKIFGVF